MLTILDHLRRDRRYDFELFSYTLDQSQPGWDDRLLREWLQDRQIPHEVETGIPIKSLRIKSQKEKPPAHCARVCDEVISIVMHETMVYENRVGSVATI